MAGKIYEPKVTAICHTFGYNSLLPNVVGSFAWQTYQGEKELIILNDNPAQKLYVGNAKNKKGTYWSLVKVCNLPVKLPSIADKYNLLSDLASGQVVVPFELGSISFPHRITQVVHYLKGVGNNRQDFFEPGYIFKELENELWDNEPQPEFTIKAGGWVKCRISHNPNMDEWEKDFCLKAKETVNCVDRKIEKESYCWTYVDISEKLDLTEHYEGKEIKIDRVLPESYAKKYNKLTKHTMYHIGNI